MSERKINGILMVVIPVLGVFFVIAIFMVIGLVASTGRSGEELRSLPPRPASLGRHH